MELQDSLPCSWASTTGSHPEPDESNPRPQSYFSMIHLLILSSHLRLRLSGGLIPSGFTTKTLYARLSYACYTPCPSYLDN